MKELLELRQYNSKTFDLGNRQRQLILSMGDTHYKNNYADVSEPWKDIDITWVGNRIDKAPYILELVGKKITVTDKRTGDISTIKLLSATPAGLKWEIVPEHTRVSFRHILPSGNVPFEAQYRVTGNIPLRTRAFDDESELELETTLAGDILTEKLSQVKDKRTGLVRPAKGSIRADPTLNLQVGAGADDTTFYWTGSVWDIAVTDSAAWIGYGQSNWLKGGYGMRFSSVTIPQGSTISSAILTVKANKGGEYLDRDTVNSTFTGEAADNAAQWSTLANYQGRRGTVVGGANNNNITAATVNFDSIAHWTDGADYSSPNLSTIISEIVGRVGWASGNALALWWDDHAARGTQSDRIMRRWYSYEGSTTYAPKLAIVYETATNCTITLAATMDASSVMLEPVAVMSVPLTTTIDASSELVEPTLEITSNIVLAEVMVANALAVAPLLFIEGTLKRINIWMGDHWKVI